MSRRRFDLPALGPVLHEEVTPSLKLTIVFFLVRWGAGTFVRAS